MFATCNQVVVIDTETTGLGPFTGADGDRICQVAAIRFDRRGLEWVPGESFSRLVDPRRPVGEIASSVNGMTWDPSGSRGDLINLFGQPIFQEAAKEVMEFIGDSVVVCHNVAFDLAVLDAELERAGFQPMANPIACTKKAFSDMKGMGRTNVYVPDTNLNKLCQLLGVSSSCRFRDGKEAPHDALVDAELTGRCFGLLERIGWMHLEDPSDLPHRLPMASAA